MQDILCNQVLKLFDFFHRPVGLLKLLILYACVKYYMPRATDYRLISQTCNAVVHSRVVRGHWSMWWQW